MRNTSAPPAARRTGEEPRPFPPRRDYVSLSVRDLLEARDAYHVHLSSLENVVATAIGRYLIRENDWYADNPPNKPRPANVPRVTTPRTLSNSVVRAWSWPAVLVFVRQWEHSGRLGRDVVPRSLYLPDGRIIPTCVVLSTPDERIPAPVLGTSPASGLLGGGYRCLRDHQGTQSVGTLGCLIQKDGSYYALTNRHVAGGDGESVRAYLRGEYMRIGQASSIAVGRVLLSTLFKGWPGDRTYLNLDAALIRLDNLDEWTAQVFGIGEVGELFDATEQSITLDLIGCPVRAFGGTTGVMEGEIQALFFRYRSLGGFDDAADVLIGPRRHERLKVTLTPLTRAGDSGAIWFYDPPDKADPADTHEDLPEGPEKPDRGARARRLRPIAMQWGGERIVLPDGSMSAFALASFLSSICRSLDAELMRTWSLGHDEYWGKIGHFAIGWKACDRVTGLLGSLMKKNQARIGFGDDTLSKGSEFRMGRGQFVPLSDVPDYVWIMSRRSTEPVQHFADVDIHDIDGGPTLLKQCVDDGRKISAQVWQKYFDGFAKAGVGPEEGCLPFRVWQIWDAMVDFLRNADVIRFVAAAGILAHYVGDASQPLHSSYLHHGVPPMAAVDGRMYPAPRTSDDFEAFKKTRAAKIHAIYEQTMLEVDSATALAGVDQDLNSIALEAANIASGHDAAVRTVRLMDEAQRRLPPMTLIDADDPEAGPKARAEALWEQANIRDATVTSLAGSVALLADLWTAAWRKGGGDALPQAQLVEFSESDLEDIYRDRSFLPSLKLATMAQSGRFEP